MSAALDLALARRERAINYAPASYITTSRPIWQQVFDEAYENYETLGFSAATALSDAFDLAAYAALTDEEFKFYCLTYHKGA